MKIMALGPVTSWEIDGETVETVSDFTFIIIIIIIIIIMCVCVCVCVCVLQITADGDCSNEIKDANSLEEKLWPT